MNAEDIRKANELCQKQAQETNLIGAQEMGLRSLECSMLTEIAAQLAELNETLNNAINSTNYLHVQVEPGQYPIVVEPKV